MIVERCEPLQSLNNGQISYDKEQLPGGGYPLFTRVTYTCANLYNLILNTNPVCQASGNGTWSKNGARCVLGNKISHKSYYFLCSGFY